jgi:hypothetical protein
MKDAIGADGDLLVALAVDVENRPIDVDSR